MILLCSANTDIRNRWKQGLADLVNIVEAGDRAAMLRELNALEPNPLLLHLQLPQLNGAGGVRSLLQTMPRLSVFVFSDKPREEEGLELLVAGIRGYANTYMDPRIIETAVDVVSKGEIWVGRRLIQRLIEDVARNSRAPVLTDAKALAQLTEREKEIAALVGQGATNKTVAASLGITERTVKAHLSRIFSKTGTKDRLQLALMVNAYSP